MAIRLDADGDTLSRTARLPLGTAFTVCGWAQQSVDKNVITGLVTLNEGADNWFYGTTTNGTTLQLYGHSGGAGTNFASSPTLLQPFFWAMKAQGTAVTAYWKNFTRNTFITASETATAAGTMTSLYIGHDPFAVSSWNGLLWDVKVWDRALTDRELLAESYSEEPVFPAKLHAWWRMQHAGDTFDYGPNKLDLTKAGTLTTEYPRVMLPKRKIVVPRVFDTVAAGGTFQTMVGPRFSLAGARGLA